MRATIIIEDDPTPENPYGVHIEMDFEPPLTDQTESNAQRLAAELLGKIGEICGQ